MHSCCIVGLQVYLFFRSKKIVLDTILMILLIYIFLYQVFFLIFRISSMKNQVVKIIQAAPHNTNMLLPNNTNTPNPTIPTSSFCGPHITHTYDPTMTTPITPQYFYTLYTHGCNVSV